MMIASSSSTSGLDAFRMLAVLALNTMLQPAGRALSAARANIVWLRASPILCLLDAAALVARFLAYIAFLHVAPSRAMLLIGKERFDEPEPSPAGRTVARLSTALRLVGFVLSMLPLVSAIREWGEFRWTVAWAWMYVASYIVLEIASQVARHELSTPQFGPADFELEDLVGAHEEAASDAASTQDAGAEASDKDEPPQGTSWTSREPMPIQYPPGRVGEDSGSSDESDESILNYGPSASTDRLIGETSAQDRSVNDDEDQTFAQAGSQALQDKSGSRGGNRRVAETVGPPNLEAMERGQSEYGDLIAEQRHSALKRYFDFADVLLLRWGCLFHAILIHWVFLDLLLPPLHHYILSSTVWDVVVVFLRLPFIFSAAILAVFGAYMAWNLLAQGIKTISAYVEQFSLPAFIQGRLAIVLFIITLAMIGLVLYGGAFGAYFFLSHLLLNDFTLWLFDVLTVEVIIVLIFGPVCYGLYLIVKYSARMISDIGQKLNLSATLGDVGAALLATFLINATLTILWYRFRYDASSQWVETWKEALKFNGTAAA